MVLPLPLVFGKDLFIKKTNNILLQVLFTLTLPLLGLGGEKKWVNCLMSNIVKNPFLRSWSVHGRELNIMFTEKMNPAVVIAGVCLNISSSVSYAPWDLKNSP